MPCCPFVETKRNWRHFQKLWLRYRKVCGFLLLYFLSPSLSLFVCCCSDRVKIFKIKLLRFFINHMEDKKGSFKEFLNKILLGCRLR